MGPATKTYVYVMKAIKSLSSLGLTLKSNIRTMWGIARITTKVMMTMIIIHDPDEDDICVLHDKVE